jgi:hypothetical protein
MSQHPVKHFKKIAREDVPQTLHWFEQQQLGTQWHLSSDEQLALLGSVDASTYQRWLADITRGQIPSLPENVITRLEILLGVEKSLEILVPENRPDLVISWFNTPNKNPLFQGKSIKQYLLDNNNLDAFHALEAYLVDAVIGFLSGSYT